MSFAKCLSFQGKLSHILTQFDHEIDDASVHKGKQMYVYLHNLKENKRFFYWLQMRERRTRETANLNTAHRVAASRDISTSNI